MSCSDLYSEHYDTLRDKQITNTSAKLLLKAFLKETIRIHICTKCIKEFFFVLPVLSRVFVSKSIPCERWLDT